MEWRHKDNVPQGGRSGERSFFFFLCSHLPSIFVHLNRYKYSFLHDLGKPQNYMYQNLETEPQCGWELKSMYILRCEYQTVITSLFPHRVPTVFLQTSCSLCVRKVIPGLSGNATIWFIQRRSPWKWWENIALGTRRICEQMFYLLWHTRHLNELRFSRLITNICELDWGCQTIRTPVSVKRNITPLIHLPSLHRPWLASLSTWRP